MRAMGQNPTMDEVKQIIREVDTDHSGSIDFFEFAAMMHRRPLINIKAEQEKLMNSFR